MTVTAKNNDAFAVFGDLHGDLDWARRAVRAAAHAGIKRILQVGDAGFCWPGRKKYKFDRQLNNILTERAMDLVFIDGNHDSHTELRSLPVEADGLARVRDRILYLPRGARFQYAGMTFGGLGGAYSVDRQWRTQGKDWWPEEEVEKGDVARLAAAGQLDVLLTHDVPMNFPGLQGQFELSPGELEQANRTRNLLQEAVDLLKPRHVFCGHWHQRSAGQLDHSDGSHIRIDVLDMNGSREGNAIFVSILSDRQMNIETLFID